MDPTRALTSSTLNPNPSSFLSDVQDVNDDFESTLSSFLLYPDPSSLNSSCDRVISQLGDDDLIDRALQRANDLHVSLKRCLLKRAKDHNSISWFLPPDLTTKIFSMLDAKSLMKVGACCTKFNESSMDPLCYSHIDLPLAFHYGDDHQALSTMIRRAGKSLTSLKLGRVCPAGSNQSSHSSFCLILLSSDQLTGNLLRVLHIYNPGFTSTSTRDVRDAILACPNLTDLKIVGMSGSVKLVLDVIFKNCHLIEHLFLEYISNVIIKTFPLSCPNLSSLTLIGFLLYDALAFSLVTCFPNLKYLDLSGTSGINGSFLRDLGSCGKDSPLETLILRNNRNLKEREVLLFLISLITGDFRSIRYMDISGELGLDTDGGRTSEPNFPLEKLKEERPGFKFVANFPPIPK